MYSIPQSVLLILTEILSIQGLGTASKKTFKKASVRSLWCLDWSEQLSQHFLQTSTRVLIMYINPAYKLHAREVLYINLTVTQKQRVSRDV